MFMGSHTMKNLLTNFDNKIDFITRKDIQISYSGHKKISRIERKCNNCFFF